MQKYIFNEKEIYISDDHKVPYSLIKDDKGQYLIMFSYKDKEYSIPAPYFAEDFPKETIDMILIVGSSFFVDDKIDDILFEQQVKKYAANPNP